MDISDYERIVSAYLDIIYRVALNCCQNKEDAEDVTQTAFLKLLNCKKTFESDENVKRWLIRVAINESHSMWRSVWRKRLVPLEELHDEPSCFQPEQIELLEFIQRLPVNYRQVIYLYYFENYHVKEIAEIMNKSESSIQHVLMRARKKLKDEFMEE